MAEKTPPAPPARIELDELGWIGHGIPAALGIAALIAAVFSYRAEIQATMTVALIFVGALLPLLTWLSMNRSRAAWSFLISLSVVLGIMTLFGAPKIRTLVGVHMSIALILPGLFAVAAFALSVQSDRYKN